MSVAFQMSVEEEEVICVNEAVAVVCVANSAAIPVAWAMQVAPALD